MPNYEVDMSYDMTEYYTHVVNGANNSDHADDLARQYIENNFDQAHNIQVDAVREVKS